MFLVAFGVSITVGILAAVYRYFEERKRTSMLIDKEHNLREYRDEGVVDDGDYKDQPYR